MNSTRGYQICFYIRYPYPFNFHNILSLLNPGDILIAIQSNRANQGTLTNKRKLENMEEQELPKRRKNRSGQMHIPSQVDREIDRSETPPSRNETTSLRALSGWHASGLLL